MADMMTFPDTVEEFMEQYKIVDTEQVYTNGTELVPIFRMRQWFEHLKPCEDAVSREAVHTVIEEVLYETTKGADNWYGLLNDGVRTLPSAQPEIIKCKDCRNNHNCGIQYHAQAGDMFFCAGAERREE